MSYEMKNILKIMIDNNEPHWSVDTMDMVRKELDRVYAQASKADEYEAKAKAWDLLKLKLDGKNKSILSNPKASDEDLDFAGNNTAVLWEMSDLEMKFRKEYEGGEPNEL